MRENEARSRPATMEDVAQQAGVNVRTVADALKGRGRVAASTRARVISIARQLDYVPNATARALATGRTGTVAVVSGPLSELFYASMVHFLEAHLRPLGVQVLLLHTEREMRETVLATQSSLVDGVIMIDVQNLAREFLHLRSPSSPPCVLIGTLSHGEADHVVLDLTPAVDEALSLMMARERVAYVVNNRDAGSHNEVRMAAYLRAMAQAKRRPEILSVDTKASPEQRAEALAHYIQAQGCPGALLCHNDETALCAARAVAACGRRVPDDVLLCGCDGLPYASLLAPSLSTVAIPMDEACATAVSFWQRRIASPELPPQKATFQGKLILRGSLHHKALP